jgi:hypothetical protein
MPWTRPKIADFDIDPNSARAQSLQVVLGTPIHEHGELSSVNGARCLEYIMRANVLARLSTIVRRSRSALEMRADLCPQPGVLNKMEFRPAHWISAEFEAMLMLQLWSRFRWYRSEASIEHWNSRPALEMSARLRKKCLRECIDDAKSWCYSHGACYLV